MQNAVDNVFQEIDQEKSNNEHDFRYGELNVGQCGGETLPHFGHQVEKTSGQEDATTKEHE